MSLARSQSDFVFFSYLVKQDAGAIKPVGRNMYANPLYRGGNNNNHNLVPSHHNNIPMAPPLVQDYDKPNLAMRKPKKPKRDWSQELPKIKLSYEQNVCTYKHTGSNFVRQRWYECRTCGLDKHKGVCEVWQIGRSFHKSESAVDLCEIVSRH